MESADPAAVLDGHVHRFNGAVRSGDFSAMVAGFTPDAQMVFEGVPAGPFDGRESIAEAYASRPPTDQVQLLGAPRIDGERVECDYAWASGGGRAGRMIATVRDGLIARLVITFE